jgi:hypothetical protein
MKALDINFKRSKVLVNLYERQLVKINDVYSDLHEDLQFEFKSRVEAV